MQRKRRSRKGAPYSTLSLLRKELREGNLQSLLGGSSYIVSSSNAAADPLLSSFILPVADEFASSQSHPNFLTETRQSKKSSDETVTKQYVYFIFQFLSFFLESFSFFFSEKKKSPLPLHGNMLVCASMSECEGNVTLLPSAAFHAILR